MKVRLDIQNLFPRLEKSNSGLHIFKMRRAQVKGDVRGTFHPPSGEVKVYFIPFCSIRNSNKMCKIEEDCPKLQLFESQM